MDVIRDKDAVLRIGESLVLAPLTVGFLYLTNASLLRFEIAEFAFWRSITGWWALLSLWWLVLKVRPTRALRPFPPLVVCLGLIIGVAWLLDWMYRVNPFDRSAPFYVLLALPFLILVHRLYRLWSYRQLAEC